MAIIDEYRRRAAAWQQTLTFARLIPENPMSGVPISSKPFHIVPAAEYERLKTAEWQARENLEAFQREHDARNRLFAACLEATGLPERTVNEGQVLAELGRLRAERGRRDENFRARQELREGIAELVDSEDEYDGAEMTDAELIDAVREVARERDEAQQAAAEMAAGMPDGGAAAIAELAALRRKLRKLSREIR